MSTQRTGILALFLVGGFFAWRNRFRIQQFLESQGISTPLMKGDIGEAFQSGVAKVSGAVKNIGRQVSPDLNEDTERSKAV